MHINNFEKLHPFVLKILSVKENLITINGHNSLTNLRKLTCNNTKLDHVYNIWSKSTGFALGFIFLSPPFSPIRFFVCHFLKLRARLLAFFRKKKRARFWGILRKKSLLSLTPLILVDYSIHIDTITMG